MFNTEGSRKIGAKIPAITCEPSYHDQTVLEPDRLELLPNAVIEERQVENLEVLRYKSMFSKGTIPHFRVKSCRTAV